MDGSALPYRIEAGATLQQSALDVIVAFETRPATVRAAVWDSFAQGCDCSARSSRAHAIAWMLKYRFKYRFRLFEIFAENAGVRRKIGQCALGLSKGGNVFLDRIALLPDELGHWSSAMSAVLRAAGPGRFQYGWELNVEPRREAELEAIPGVSLETVTPLVVQAIDFSQWESWDAFMRAMRKGARQSAQFARRDIPDLKIESWRGRNCARAVPALLRLRTDLSKRKSLGLRWPSLVASYLGWMFLCPAYTRASLVRGNGRALAVNFRTEFGSNTYYLEAGSVVGNQGASWALVISTIREAYDRDPCGRFVMGYINFATHDEEVGGGLVRSRTAVRAVDYPTSVVTFKYAP